MTDREQALETVLKAHARSSAFLRPVHQKWRRDFKIMRGLNYQLGKNGPAWKSDVRVPIARAYFDIVVSRFFQGMPAAKAVALNLASSVNQDSFNELLNRDQDSMGLPSIINPFVKDAIEKGFGCFRDGWRTETPDTVTHTKEWMDKKLKQAKKTNAKAKLGDIFYDGPEGSWVDPFLCWWDPASYEVDMGAWFGETEFLNDSEVLRHPAIDKATAKKGIEGKVEFNADVRERLKSLGYGTQDVSKFAENAKNGLNEILWYWGLWDVNGDGIDEECRIGVVNRTHATKPVENPYEHGQRPYNVWSFDVEPGSMIGFSFMDRVRSAQVEYDDATNHYADNRKLTNNPVITYVTGTDLDPQFMEFAPGLPLPVENQGDIAFEHMPDFGPSLNAYLVALREVMQLLSGANDVALGQQDVGIGDNTATGSSIAQEQTEMRFKQPAIMLDLAIERFGNHLISNIHQYRDGEQEIMVMDGDTVQYKTIQPKQYQGSFSYRMESGTLNQDTGVMRVNKLMKLKEVVGQNPAYDLGKVDDKIVTAMGEDPSTLKAAAQSPPSDAASKIAALPPEAQAKAMEVLAPEDRELLTKLLASTQNGQPQPAPGVGALPGIPQPPPGMGAPVGAIAVPAGRPA